MNQRYLYLAIDILTILVPLVASFYPKAPFYKKWKYLWIAILIPAVIFLLWDEVFTRFGIWGFNERYLTGFFIGTLPIEEVLFFVCIPYSCTFIYFAMNYLVKNDWLYFHQDVISSVISVTFLLIGGFNLDKAYTAVTFLLTGMLIALHLLKLRSRFMGRFYISFLIVLVPFFIVNGILTGSFIPDEVVWYNDEENLKIRMGTIPVEDAIYGMLLLLLNVSIFEWLQQTKKTTRFVTK